MSKKKLPFTPHIFLDRGYWRVSGGYVDEKRKHMSEIQRKTKACRFADRLNIKQDRRGGYT